MNYSFLPQGGTAYGDLFLPNFVDLDPTPGLLDWDCTEITYDGHQGLDFSIRSFAEQEAGVPVFAVLDGTVVNLHDGEPDHNTGGEKVKSNFVTLCHGGSRYSAYLHLRSDSISVSLGQEVAAGTQLGLTASSGYSYWPHLHLESWINGIPYDPNAGSCRAGESYWDHQVPIRRDTHIWDFNVSGERFEEYPGLPYDIPRTGHFNSGKQNVSFWVQVMNLPAQSHWLTRYIRPDGSVALEGIGGFDNPFWLGAWWWWRQNLDLDQTGVWSIELEVNGAKLVEAPFDVIPVGQELENRAPKGIEASLEPSFPREGNVILCRVALPHPPGDQDYDLVLYRYEWFVDGVPVRDNTFAGTADALARDLYHAGNLVECRVRPTDGRAFGPGVTVSAVMHSGVPLASSISGDPITGQAPLTVSFESEIAGGIPPYTQTWDFGDGAGSQENSPTHTFTLSGTYVVNLSVKDSVGEETNTPPLTVRVLPVPPVITSVGKLFSPFRLKLDGSGFKKGIRAEIDDIPWEMIALKSETRLVLKGGGRLKSLVPKGVPVSITLTNPDGGYTNFVWTP